MGKYRLALANRKRPRALSSLSHCSCAAPPCTDPNFLVWGKTLELTFWRQKKKNRLSPTSLFKAAALLL